MFFSALIGKVPLIGQKLPLMVLLINWILKWGGAFYVGYQTVKKHQGTSLQASVSGGIFGAGIGVASIIVSLKKIILSSTLPGMSGRKFWFLTVIFSEALMIIIIFFETLRGLFLGLIGGIVAEDKIGKKNKTMKGGDQK